MPGSRSIHAANSGLVDGEVGRLKFVLGKYKNLRLVPVPIFVAQLTVFTRNPDITLGGWDSLTAYRTATPGSFNLVVNNLKGNPHVSLTNNATSALNLLNENMVDIAVLNRYEGSRLIDVFGFREILVLNPPLETLPIYRLLHKKMNTLSLH
ncbi:MAG TPA: hypothetical protein ENH92_00410 [Ectothiorhodospiraceae bacterium]|nr:hypothetical protein [Ectothiorhodospiraceae bacterium]